MFGHQRIVRTRKLQYGLFAVSLVVTMLIQAVAPAFAQVRVTLPVRVPEVAASQLLFRVEIETPSEYRFKRLEQLGIQVLERRESTTVVVVDAEQLKTLGQLSYRPDHINELSGLVASHAADQPQLAHTVAPLLAEVANSERQMRSGAEINIAPLLKQVGMLSNDSQRALAALTDQDSDGDGLSDSSEANWCTNPAIKDSDNDGTSDGAEVAALRDWIENKRATYPSTGKPFLGWPFNQTTCVDSDKDSVPDNAEHELGLNANRESTDRDKFDDGQELFGLTHCTGEGGYCSYGPLPRNEDWGVIFAEMPAWLIAPGNHPLVAAFPIPEVDILVNSIQMEANTTVTTDHVISKGEEETYGTADTTGSSTSVANEENWSSFYQVTVSRTAPSPRNVVPNRSPNNWFKNLFKGEAEFDATNSIQGQAGGAVSGCGLTLACASASFNNQMQATIGKIEGTIEGSLFKLKDSTVNFNTTLDGFKDNFSNWLNNSNFLNNNCIGICGSNIHLPSFQVENNLDVAAIRSDRGMVGPNFNVSAGANNQVQSVAYYQPFQVGYSLRPSQWLAQTTRGETQGSSTGGSRTVTNTEYEEHTVTRENAFSSTESWGTATAVNSAHAANLWFTYQVRNVGTDYAYEICDLVFNVYLGDEQHPIYSYFVSPDLGGDGCFNSLRPGDNHEITTKSHAHPIPLSLPQMQAIDTGTPLRIVLEDYTYGIDEYYYADAASAGIAVGIDNGVDDGSAEIDTYVLPTWGSETVLEVMARYFPHTVDEQGQFTAIWTPEYRNNTPGWCVEPRVVGTGANRTVWCKHALSTADWWNVYTNGLGDGTQGFQDTPASGNSVALFRFNKDSDLDGYSDRSEDRFETDKLDATSFPRPELTAGIHQVRVGDTVTATLSLLNSGVYDAYGIEAVMIAPDDTTTILNNTVGGSGRVRALDGVVVGSRILDPVLGAAWNQATGGARPVADGYFTGSAERTYTFTVNCPPPTSCAVGSGTWTLDWIDSANNSGALNFANGYASPSLRDVGTAGVKLAMISGSVVDDATFTVLAHPPLDTFQYEINSEPHTPPLVVVSYNDPQGNHRFIIPASAMNLAAPESDLVPHTGTMLDEFNFELVTSAPAALGSNTLHVALNNPTDTTLTDAHLFVEFIDITGTVAAEVPITVTLPAGPSVVPVAWDTANFNPAYVPTDDYIVMAFWTDYDGNILDTAGRPLSSFQADPQPSFVLPGDSTRNATWNFGSVPQGTVVRYELDAGNIGHAELQLLVNAPGLALHGTREAVGPADTRHYELVLDTAQLPAGPYSQMVTIRSNDVERPVETILITGDILTDTINIPAGDPIHPLDYAVTITGTHSQGEWVTFTHPLGPDTQTIHPVFVYSADFDTRWGVGRYATGQEGANVMSYEMFGDGRDGPMPSSGNLDNNTGIGVGVVYGGSAGSTQIDVSDAHGVWRISPGDRILLHQSQGANAGCWEINTAVSDIAGGRGIYQVSKPLNCNYSTNGNNHAQIQRIPQYSTCNVTGTITQLTSWNGFVGGIIAVMCQLSITVSGAILVNGGNGGTGSTDWPGAGYGGGFRGGRGDHVNNDCQGGGDRGEGTPGPSDNHHHPNGNGGASGDFNNCNGASAGGGGNGGRGGNGSRGNLHSGEGGYAAGNTELTNMVFGGGGGGSSHERGRSGGGGGSGGGIIVLLSPEINISGQVRVNGGNGGSGEVGGGGGAGGSILLRGRNIAIGSSSVSAAGGGGGASAGGGGVGRIRVEYCEQATGSSYPSASFQPVGCHIIEQIEGLQSESKLRLPESFSDGRTYNIQYGRRLVYGGAGEQTTTLRIPAGGYLTASIDTLISGVGTGDVNIKLDIGNDGTWDWDKTQPISSAGTLPAEELAAAFNAYWVAQGAPLTGDLDVPVRVSLSKGGQLLLTNLVMQPLGSTLRQLPPADGAYSNYQLGLALTGNGSGDWVVSADVNNDGTIDWSTSGSGALTRQLTTGNLATAINAAPRSGNIPVRFFHSGNVTLAVAAIETAFSQPTDIGIATADISFSHATPTEGTPVTISAVLRNGQPRASAPVVVAFTAELPAWGDWYLGSVLVPSVPAEGTATATLEWDTFGFVGSYPIKVTVDPYNRVAESNEMNNEARANVTVLTRPDLTVTAIAPQGDMRHGLANSVVVTVANGGQTAANGQTLRLYDSDPAAGGSVVAAQTVNVPAGGSVPVPLAWTPARRGDVTLFAVADAAATVDEYDEANNSASTPVKVGWGAPLHIDVAGPSDQAYSAADGFGHTAAGTVNTSCGSGPLQTYRSAASSAAVEYRLDHLLPNRAYWLDVGLFVCSGNRPVNVKVDGATVVGNITANNQGTYRGVRLDPAAYADGSVVVRVERASGLNGPVLSELLLTDIYRCYRDSGSATNDPAYTSDNACGFVEPPDSDAFSWDNSTDAVQTIRFGADGVRYRFGNLNPALAYALDVTFYEDDATGRVQTVSVDGVPLLEGVVLSATTRRETLALPPASYADGSVDVLVSAAHGELAVISEIAVTEQTLAPPNTPSNPLPANAATGIGLQPILTWTGGDREQGDSPTYAVRFGTSNPPLQVATGLPTAQYTPPLLSGSTTYYWQVVSTDRHGLTATGPVWSFDTDSGLLLWDSFEGDLSGWDAVIGDVGDLALAPTAGRHGSGALRATLNDNNWLYVRDDLPAATDRYTARFYFDPNHTTMADGDAFELLQGRAANGQLLFQIQLWRDGYRSRIRAFVYSDSGALTSSGWTLLTDTWHALELGWQAASAAGANDGSFGFWIDRELRANISGLDNDARQLASVRLGAFNVDAGTRGTLLYDQFASQRGGTIGLADSLLFSDDFEVLTMQTWSGRQIDGGDLWPHKSCAINGTAGLRLIIDDNTSIFAHDSTPYGDATYRASFLFNAAALSMAPGDDFNLLTAQSNRTFVLRLRLLRAADGSYQLATHAQLDTTGGRSGAGVPVDLSQTHHVEVQWQAASAAGANDGSVLFWLDGVLVDSLTGLDTDAWSIDHARLGASALDNGTRGTLCFDDFVSYFAPHVLSRAPKLPGGPAAAVVPEGPDVPTAVGSLNRLAQPAAWPLVTALLAAALLAVVSLGVGRRRRR